jgi:hypothetical protein
MRRSLIFTVFALGAQAAWAQDAAEPMVPDAAVVEDTAEITEPVVEEADSQTAEETLGTDTDVVDEADPAPAEDTVAPPTETADEEPIAEDTETAEGDGTDSDGVVDEEPAPAHVDDRSATGAFRGGHHGTVSTLARAGLGSVFGTLRSQGYGDIQIEQLGGVINVSAARGGEIRHLSYSASSGALLSDATGPRSLLETIAGKLKGKPDTAGFRSGSEKAHGKDKTAGKGNHSDTKKDGANKGHSGESRGKSGGGKRGGNGKGGGRNK